MQLFLSTSDFYKRFDGAVSITAVLEESENKVEGFSPRLRVRAQVKPFLFFILVFTKKQQSFRDLHVCIKSTF